MHRLQHLELCPLLQHARYTAARLYQSSLLVQPVERLPLLLQLRLLQRLRLLQLRRSPAGVEGRAGLAPPAFRTPHSRTAALPLPLRPYRRRILLAGGRRR